MRQIPALDYSVPCPSCRKPLELDISERESGVFICPLCGYPTISLLGYWRVTPEEWKRAGLTDGINRIIAYGTLFLFHPVVSSIGVDDLLLVVRIVLMVIDLTLLVLLYGAIRRLIRCSRGSGHVFVYTDGVEGLYGRREWRFAAEKDRRLRLRPVLRSVTMTAEGGMRFRFAGIFVASLLIPVPDAHATTAREIATWLDEAAHCGEFPERSGPLGRPVRAEQ